MMSNGKAFTLAPSPTSFIALCGFFLGARTHGLWGQKRGRWSLLAASASAPRDTLNFGSMKDIRDINPHLYLGEMAAQGMVFEALTKNTKEGVKPWLAESWEISPDGKVYNFPLA